MIKIMWLLKRKPGITFEEFQDHYEKSHSELGKEYFGHLIKRYRRNYNDRRILDTTPPSVAVMMVAKQWDYDCITEWEFEDEAALAEVMRLVTDPEISRIHMEDEEHFLDLNSVRYFLRCDTRDTGVTPAR